MILFLVNRALDVRNFVRIEREFDGEQFEVDLVGAWLQPKSQPAFKAANRQSEQCYPFGKMALVELFRFCRMLSCLSSRATE